LPNRLGNAALPYVRVLCALTVGDKLPSSGRYGTVVFPFVRVYILSEADVAAPPFHAYSCVICVVSHSVIAPLHPWPMFGAIFYLLAILRPDWIFDHFWGYKLVLPYLGLLVTPHFWCATCRVPPFLVAGSYATFLPSCCR
jgi:hypothetical protein